jgi:hypothetical protein
MLSRFWEDPHLISIDEAEALDVIGLICRRFSVVPCFLSMLQLVWYSLVSSFQKLPPPDNSQVMEDPKDKMKCFFSLYPSCGFGENDS